MSKTALGAGFVLILLLLGGAAFLWFDLGSGPAPVESTSDEVPHRLPERGPHLRGAHVGDVQGAGAAIPDEATLWAGIDRKRDVHGVVADPSGAPIAGAIVACVTYPWRRVWVLDRARYMEGHAGAQARTDRHGAFRLRLRAGDVVGLRVSRPGFAPVEVPLVQAGERLRIVLHPGVALRVRLLDETGKPIPQIAVRLTRARGVRDATFEHRSTTDDRGEHRFSDLPPSLVAWADASKEGVGWSGLHRVELPKEGESVVEIVLKSGRTLSGRVTDASTGDPIAGARVGMSHRMAAAVRTGVDGRYVLPGWTGRSVRTLHVLREGYGREKAVVGRADTYDFELHRGFAITARILDLGGAPVVDAHVVALAAEQRSGEKVSSWASAETGEAGRVVLRSLRRDLGHTLVVSAEGQGRVLLDVDPPEPGTETVAVGDIVLSEARSIAGRAELAPGEPARRMPVYLHGHNGDRARRRGDAGTLSQDVQLRDRLLTDDIGRFRFAGLAPGSYEIRFAPEGARPVAQEVALGPREDVSDVLLRSSWRYRVGVEVSDEAGPVEGLVVLASLETGQSLAATTDTAGTCELRADVPIRNIRTSSHVGPQRRTFMPVDPVDPRPGQRTVVFVLSEATGIAGQVLAPDGRGLPRARVYLEPGDGYLATADAQGRFRALLPLEGRHTLRAAGRAIDGEEVGAERRMVQGTASVNASTHRGVLLIPTQSVEQDQHVDARVLDPAGNPVSGVDVSAVGPRGLFRRSARTNADGVAHLDRLPSVAVEVMLGAANKGMAGGRDPSRLWVKPRPVSVLPAGQLVELWFRRGIELRGVTRDAERNPVPGARVTCWKGEDHLATAVTNLQGRFTLQIPEDEQGPLEVRAERSESGTARWRGALSGVRPRGDPLVLLMKPVR